MAKQYNLSAAISYDYALSQRRTESLLKALSTKPVVIKAEVKNISTTELDNVFRQIQSRAKNIEKITVRVGTIEKTNMAGNTETLYNQALDAVITKQTKSGDLIKQNVNLLSSGERILQVTGTSYNNIGTAQRKLNAELNKSTKELTTINEKVENWLAKSSNMSGKEVEKTRMLGADIQADYVKYTALVDKGTKKSLIDASKLKDAILIKEAEFNKQVAGFQKVAGSLRTWTEAMGNAIKQTISYSLSIGMVQAALQSIREGVEYIKEINSEMTKIQVLGIDGARTSGQIETLRNSYNGLARELGTTTTEIAKGSVEWLRQGKSIEETSKLLRSSTMLAKLGALDSAQSTEYLTAISNAYKLSAEETALVVDKLIAVDNIAATSAGELATALRYTAVSAQEAGIGFEDLVSYIATVSSVTRGSSESIGQAFKTITARMTDVKKGIVDEDGLGINAVSDALGKVGISIMNSSNDFRDLNLVLREVADKWDTLSETEQNEIAKSVAGVRQRETFFVLMNNMGMAIEFQNEQMNVAGQTADRYKIYLQNLEAAQSKLTVSFEEFWQGNISQDMILGMYNLASITLDLITAMGGLPPIIGLVITYFILLKSVGIASFFATLPVQIAAAGGVMAYFSTATQLAASSMLGLNAAMAANPVGVIAIAVGVLILSFMAFNAIARDTAKELEDSNRALDEFTNNINKMRKNVTAVEELAKEYDKLTNSARATTEEQERYIEVQNELKTLLPELSGKYNEQGNFIIANKDAIKELLVVQREQIENEKQLEAIEQRKNARLKVAEYNKLASLMKFYEYNKDYTGGTTFGLTSKSKEEMEEDVLKLKNSYLDLKETFINSNAYVRETMISDLENSLEYVDTNKEAVRELIKVLNELNNTGSEWARDDYMFDPDQRGTASPVEKVKTEFDYILEASKNAYDTRIKQEKTFTVQQIDEAIKRAETLKDIDKDALDRLKEYRKQVFQKQMEEEKTFYEQILKATIDMLKQRLNNEKDALQKQIQGINDEADARKERLKERFDQEKRIRDDRKRSIEEETAGIKNVVSAEKELLDAKRAEEDFNRSLAEKNKKYSDLQTEIAILQLDNSQEAIAKRMQLEEDASKAKEEIDLLQTDRTRDLEDRALENLVKLEEARHESRLKNLEEEELAANRSYEILEKNIDRETKAREKSLQARIDELDRYLSQEGELNIQAMNMIKFNTEQTFIELINWNKTYGDGLSETITKAWDKALDYLQLYKEASKNFEWFPEYSFTEGNIEGAPIRPSGYYDKRDELEYHHSGIDSGRAGGMRNDEVLSMLTKDELVFKPNQIENLMKNIFRFSGMPQTSSNNSTGNITIEMPINVAGNLDKTVIPDLQEIADNVITKINKSMQARGHLRLSSTIGI